MYISESLAFFYKERGVNLPKLALNYAFSFENIPTTLSSPGTVDMLEDTLNCMEKELTPYEKDAREEVMTR